MKTTGETCNATTNASCRPKTLQSLAAAQVYKSVKNVLDYVEHLATDNGFLCHSEVALHILFLRSEIQVICCGFDITRCEQLQRLCSFVTDLERFHEVLKNHRNVIFY